MRITSYILLIGLLAASTAAAAVSEAEFGKMPDGAPIKAWTITNAGGASVTVMEYGASITSLKMPDRTGKLDDIVLGFDSLDGYLRPHPFFGATVGRFANRIAGASFKLDGTEYHLTANDRRNVLHGGRKGFDKVVWSGAKVDDQTVSMTYLSKDGEEGFPGNCTVKVEFSLNDGNELKIDYTATTDKPTVINLANHSYFNLAGQASGDVLKHELMIDADRTTPVAAGLIPTGELKSVEGTPFDFRSPHPIGDKIDADDAQLRLGGGYDHNWVLNRKADGQFTAAKVYEPSTGRALEITTTEPALQFYSGNGLGNITGKGGVRYVRRGGFCLEPQHYPDSPNHPDFPSTTLRPGETFHSTSIYKFTAR